MDEIPRIPFAQTISTRDSTMMADAIMYNYFATKNSDGRVFSERRFGFQSIYTAAPGMGLGLFQFKNSILSIIGTTFYVNGVSTGTVDNTSPYQFTLTGVGATGVFLKNNTHAYTWDGSALVQVTDANYPSVTAPGVAWLDGYVFVQTPGGILANSNLNTPAVWGALNTISGSLSSDNGAAITRLYNYVVSFGVYSTTFFYDAGNSIGSPLLPNISAELNIGCAVGTSVVASENTVFWIGQTHQKGRRVYMFEGLTPKPISDEFIDKILNQDSLNNVYAYYLEINGAALYVLTLTNSNCTLVYNLVSGMWSRWSSSSLGSSRVADSATQVGTKVIVVLPGHGFSNPTIVLVTSEDSAGMYRGVFVIDVIDVNTFSYTVGNVLIGGVSGGINSSPINRLAINNEFVISGVIGGLGTLTITPFVQNYFAPVYYAYANNIDYLLDVANGMTYIMQQDIANDNGNFIYGLLRTNAGDFGTNNQKFFPSLQIIADKVPAYAYLGYSDNDFYSYSSFRPISLNANRALLRRCGAARRRAFCLLYYGGYAARFYQLELPDLVVSSQ
jgi:hypothetical protein